MQVYHWEATDSSTSGVVSISQPFPAEIDLMAQRYSVNPHSCYLSCGPLAAPPASALPQAVEGSDLYSSRTWLNTSLARA